MRALLQAGLDLFVPGETRARSPLLSLPRRKTGAAGAGGFTGILVLLLAGSGLLASPLVRAAQPAGAGQVKAAGQEWQKGRKVDGVQVYHRPTTTAIREHRAETLVCTELTALEAFVSDAGHFTEWVPFTRSARLLERMPDQIVYYVRSITPWPLADRDMIYRVRRLPDGGGVVRLELTGLPDFRPEVEGATRIRSARGAWLLVPEARGVRVSYQLLVDPGAVPAFVANRRLASVVGQTLANLAARFPCDAADAGTRGDTD